MFDVSQMLNQDGQLAKDILSRMYPNVKFKEEQREEKAIKDIKWMLLFVAEAYKANRQSIIVNLVNWFKELFIGLNIEPYHADLLFETTREVLKEKYNDEDFSIFLNNIDIERTKQIKKKTIENPYKTEQKQYLSYLLDSQKDKAKSLIFGMVEKNISIEDIYLYVFQATMREVGEQWQHGKIHVGREHYCTAVTQLLMSSLYEYIFTSHEKDKRMMACAVGSELHEIGIRMVADFFEMNEWETSYLGANLPKEQIISYAKDFNPHIIALSITMPYHISELKNTIEAIKKNSQLKDKKIIVGGIPFLDDPDLYQYVGADAVAMNAKEGIKIAEELLQ